MLRSTIMHYNISKCKSGNFPEVDKQLTFGKPIIAQTKIIVVPINWSLYSLEFHELDIKTKNQIKSQISTNVEKHTNM